jgi:hypothetical protein
MKKDQPSPKRKFSRSADWVLDLESDGISLTLHTSGQEKYRGGHFSISFGMIWGGPKPVLAGKIQGGHFSVSFGMIWAVQNQFSLHELFSLEKK